MQPPPYALAQASTTVRIAGKELVARFHHRPHPRMHYLRFAGLYDCRECPLPAPEWLQEALTDQYAKLCGHHVTSDGRL